MNFAPIIKWPVIPMVYADPGRVGCPVYGHPMFILRPR